MTVTVVDTLCKWIFYIYTYMYIVFLHNIFQSVMNAIYKLLYYQYLGKLDLRVVSSHHKNYY